MPRFIIHKDGAYNFYTTVADGACYERAMTLDELRAVVRFEHGEAVLHDLPGRLERAHATGCSGIGYTLDDCISSNRAGPNESRMPADEFIARYLTLDAATEQQEAK